MDASTKPRHGFRSWKRTLNRSVRRTFLRPQMVAFLPALMLGGYWFGSQGVFMIIALTLPMVLALGGLFDQDQSAVDGLTGLLTEDALAEAVDDSLSAIRTEAEMSVVVAIEIDEGAELSQKLGPQGMESVLCRISDRLTTSTRSGDRLARLGDFRFGVLLAPMRHAGMDVALRTVERLQGAVSEPISVDAGSVYLTVSAGICLERRAPDHTGEAMILAAKTALEEARSVGGGAVRNFSSEMSARIESRIDIARDFSRALEEGEILPWFQPQVCARTGQVTGVEALARWQHPTKGIISPAVFLPAAEASGVMEKLGEVMLFHGLAALRHWDREGLHVPSVGVNFSSAELRNPKLIENIRWELDRFDLSPERLTVEVLENVVAVADNDIVTTNIAGLSKLGCTIDLDDFGTGAASISNIRRFAVSRIKIDRSFVTSVDSDPAQRQIVDALLSLAGKLGLKTVAEGVETMSEHLFLAELGCDHIQGYAVARPMPREELESWLKARGQNPQGFGQASISA